MTAASALAPRVTISLTPVVSFLVFMALFAGFQGGRYVFSNRLQELGILFALILFVLGAWLAFFRLPAKEWQHWVYTPIALLGGIMVLWSAVFSLTYSDNFMFSLFASREYFLGFIGPAVFLLCRSGYPLESLQRVVWLALGALMVNYLFFYSTMDLRQTFFSPDHTVSNLVTYDEWRGFRLKPPTFAIMVALMGSLFLLFQARTVSSFFMALVLAGLCSYIWSIVQFRSTLATMILSALIYPFMMRQPKRMKFLFIVAPLIVIALPVAFQFLLEHFSNADGGSLRLRSYNTAFQNIARQPLLGTGEDNSYGKTFQSLFGKTFYPSDLGMIGTAFKYGLLGLGLYLFMHFLIWARLLRANSAYADYFGTHNPLLWGMLIFSTAQSFNLILNPGLSYAQGITLGSFSLAFASLWYHYVASNCRQE